MRVHGSQLSLSQPRGIVTPWSGRFPITNGGIFIKRLSLLLSLVCAVCELGVTSHAFGHGFAGARFFPATLSTDDPFVSDELSLPTISTIRTPDDGGTRETDISVDIAKRITPQFAIEIGETLSVLNPHEGQTTNGFGNLNWAENISS